MRILPLLAFLPVLASAAPPVLDESPATPDNWGYRPDNAKIETNPPGFVWRPNKTAGTYEWECAADPAFTKDVRRAQGITLACYCPDKPLPAGTYHWRYRLINAKGEPSAWSKVRTFEVAAGAVEFPMPPREELLGRIPKDHPRLFVRPEQMDDLRKRAAGDLKPQYAALIKQADALLKTPPPTAEPPKYGPDAPPKSEKWREIWWGNRVYTIKVLDGAATLGFAHLLTPDAKKRDAYAQLGRRLLMDAAEWDPKGSTNYHYNDEAGMPYVYYFARSYTFLSDVLSDADKAKCRAVIRVRGNEMYAHLNPRHLWSPYASHSNRAWHKLGEAGIAFLGEVPEAADWVWLAMNVFWNVYPVWADEQGGWHEGVSYWNSYIERFTYFADSMRSAMNVDAFKKPYFARVGYYTMYLQPPGTPGGGFGDLVPERPAKDNARLMTALAAQARNPYWQGYAQALGGPLPEPGYIGFVRGALPAVDPKPPTDLPTSRCFYGTGQAYLNTTLTDAKDNVELGFKSSPFGTQSHGYDANNSFFLYAFGQRLLAPTGRRDIYGSDHHAKWMWEAKSTNTILVNGKGQTPRHSSASVGKIVAFQTSPTFDYVAGDASTAYGPAVKRFVRHVFFFKPDLIVIYDDLETTEPGATIDWLLHSPAEIKANGQTDLTVTTGGATARASVLWPEKAEVSVTDQYETPPRARIKVKECHLTARAKSAGTQAPWLVAIKVGRDGQPIPVPGQFQMLPDGRWTADFNRDRGSVRIEGMTGSPPLHVRVEGAKPTDLGW